MYKLLTTLFLLFLINTGCASNGTISSDNPIERQINKSILIESGLNFEIGGLPIQLPTFGIGFKFFFRRPTNQEEIDLNLSKLGKWRGMPVEPVKPKLSSPKPIYEGK